MKKIFISLLAVAALAACTKSEVQYEPAGEIGFAPVASNVTKSVAGYTDGTFDGVFPTGVDLYVFAEAGTGEYADANYDLYFTNALFKHKTGGVTESVTEGDLTIPTTGAYAGSPSPYYWPNVKTVVFAGYSDACNAKDGNASMDFANNILTINNYTQSNYTATTTDGNTTYSYPAEGANDLMWFPFDGTEYDKQSNEIIAKMKHACSWITIKVVGDGVTGGNWKLNALELQNVIHEATKVECGTTTAVWTIADNATKTDEVVYSNGTTVIPAPATGDNPSSTAAKLENYANNTIVIPQTPTDLEVTYTYVSQEGATDEADITLTETKPVSLKYDGDKAWEPGVHYIYTITITATEILIDPYVTAWTETTVTPEKTI